MFSAALRSTFIVLLAVALGTAAGAHRGSGSLGIGTLEVELCSGKAVPGAAGGDNGPRDPCPECLRAAAALLPGGAGAPMALALPRPTQIAGDAAWYGRDATPSMKRVRGPPRRA